MLQQELCLAQMRNTMLLIQHIEPNEAATQTVKQRSVSPPTRTQKHQPFQNQKKKTFQTELSDIEQCGFVVCVYIHSGSVYACQYAVHVFCTIVSVRASNQSLRFTKRAAAADASCRLKTNSN
jgi:hypothetical protein